LRSARDTLTTSLMGAFVADAPFSRLIALQCTVLLPWPLLSPLRAMSGSNVMELRLPYILKAVRPSSIEAGMRAFIPPDSACQTKSKRGFTAATNSPYP